MTISEIIHDLDKYGYSHVPLEEWIDTLCNQLPPEYKCTIYGGTMFVTLTTEAYNEEQKERMNQRKWKKISKKEEKKQAKEN